MVASRDTILDDNLIPWLTDQEQPGLGWKIGDVGGASCLVGLLDASMST